MAAVATTLRSLLLTATGSVTVLGAVLAIRATTPAGQADVSPAPISSPAGTLDRTLDGTLGRPGETTGATGASGIFGVLGTGLMTGGDRAPGHSQDPWGASGRLGAPEPPGAPARWGDPAIPETVPEAPLPRGTVVAPGTPVSPVVPIPLGAPAAPGLPIPQGASARSVFPGFPGFPQSPPLPPY